MATLIALRQLTGRYSRARNSGLVFTAPGEQFDTDEKTALALEARGLAVRYRLPPLDERIPAPESPTVSVEAPMVMIDYDAMLEARSEPRPIIRSSNPAVPPRGETT